MRRQRGLTLMEMLLTLMLSALAISLALQVLGQYQRAQASAIRTERAGREYALTERWLRDSISGLVADSNEAFSGDANGWSGTTVSPVVAPQGIPAKQVWRISRGSDDKSWLSLEENMRSLELPVRPSSGLRFYYLSRSGELHDAWPIKEQGATTLPAAVLMELSHEDRRPQLVLAAVAAELDPIDARFEPDQDW